MRVVLDTNVLIAAFITRGACSTLLEHCFNQHELITSDFILNEFRDKLTQKFNFNKQDIEEAIQLLQSKMEIVVPSTLEVPVFRDPDDDQILGTALAGHVTSIVTGDKDLLVIKKLEQIEIFQPSDFAEFEARHS